MMSRELKVVITKKEAPYAPSEQLGEYTVRRWTFRQKQEAISRASTILDETKGLVEMHLVDYQIEQILTCVTPPEGFDFNRETIKDDKIVPATVFDADVGDLLLAACRKVNGTTASERANFLEQSEEVEDTPG